MISLILSIIIMYVKYSTYDRILESNRQKEEIEKKLLDTTGYKKVEIEYITDPSLIGGIVIRVGDRVVDGSIRTRLYELKRGLI